MKYRIINILAWLLAFAVIMLAVSRIGRTADHRTRIIRIDGTPRVESAPKRSAEYPDTPSSETLAFFDANPDSSADDDTSGTSSSVPEAVAANDSATVLMSQGNNKAATVLLRKAVELDPEYARAHYNLGIAYHRVNNLSKAIKEYQRAFQIRPFYYKPVYNLGLLYLSIGDYDNALTWFTRAVTIRKSQEAAPAYFNLGLVYTRLGNRTKATQSYREALRLQPGYVEARYNLALQLMDDAKYEDAATEFKKVAALGFNKAKLFTNLGICYSRLDMTSDAVTAYQNAVSVDTADASTWFNLAVGLNRMDRLDESLEAYRRAIALDSSYYEAHFNMAMMFDDRHQPDSAIVHYRRATLINPSYSKAYYNMALVYSDRHLMDSAAACYRRVVELDPENMKALFNLGLTYSRMDDFGNAVLAYRTLIDQDPVNEKGLTNLGVTFMRINEYDSAFVYFDRLVGLTHSPEAFYNRARAYSELGKPSSAMQDYREAIRINPEYAKAYHNLAILEEQDGDLEQAVILLQRAIEVDTDSDSWKSHWKLGQIYSEMGLLDKARSEYAIAAKSNPQSDKFGREYRALFGKS